jgi:hypothetical protein
MMQVDANATRAARARHEQGVKLLREALVQGKKGGLMAYIGQQHASIGRNLPGNPTRRGKAYRRQRRLARAAAKRNRAR